MSGSKGVAVASVALVLTLPFILVGSKTCGQHSQSADSARERGTTEVSPQSQKCCNQTAETNTLAGFPQIAWSDTLCYSADGSETNTYRPLKFRNPKSGLVRTVWVCDWVVADSRLFVVRFQPDSDAPPEALYGASSDLFPGYGRCLDEVEEVLLDGAGTPVGFRKYDIPDRDFVWNPIACGKYVAYWSYDPAWGDDYDYSKRRVYGNIYDVITGRRLQKKFVMYNAVITDYAWYFPFPEWSDDGCCVRFLHSWDDTVSTRLWLSR